MDRRGFLGRLLGGLAVAAVAPALDLFPDIDAAAANGFPIAAIPTYRDVFRRMAHEATEQFANALPHSRYHLLETGWIGQGGLTHQHGIDLIPSMQLSDANFLQFMDRTVSPAMVKLAYSVHSASRFGKLPIPETVDQACRVEQVQRGISMRTILDYRVGWDDHILRFDVVTD